MDILTIPMVKQLFLNGILMEVVVNIGSLFLGRGGDVVIIGGGSVTHETRLLNAEQCYRFKSMRPFLLKKMFSVF